MALTIKTLLTLTLAVMFSRAWSRAISATTIRVMAERAPRLSTGQVEKAKELSGKFGLQAVGVTLWTIALTVGIWGWL